jgi:two-component system, NtrC family, sensor kinase
MLLLAALGAHAQGSWPEAFKVSADSLEYEPMDEKYWQYLSTGKDSVSFTRISRPEYDKKFRTFNYVYDNSNFNVRIGESVTENAWIRFKLYNPDAHPLQLAFSVPVSRATYYFSQNGKWQDYTTGYMVPRNKKDGIKRFNYILYTIKPYTEVTVYAYYKRKSDSRFSPKPVNYNAFVKEVFHEETVYTLDDIITAAFFGFISFGIVFNLLFYYVNRERVYLVYSITLLVAAMATASDVIDTAFFENKPGAGNIFVAFSIIALIVMVIQTLRLFFRIRKYYPRWDTFLVWSPFIFLILGAVVYLIPEGNIKRIVSTSIAVLCIAVILTFIVGTIIMLVAFLRKKNKEARIFVLAALPFAISLLLSMFTDDDFSILFSGIWVIGVLTWAMFARFKNLQIENARAALEKEEERNNIIAEQNERLEHLVTERTAELEASLKSLKETQAQLIQSEKMASLGELTAGIAHEIQNPLNFVNNFSDVSIELIEEMEEELDNGDTDEVKAIAGDIKQNLEKIAHHGRRADSIVKGMLQHSRASSGQKEPTDINALADEYLRLAYHGLRAKDKTFNAALVTDFDAKLPKVNVITQDMGRVLLNLFTNAFYATQQKVKSPPTPKEGETVPYNPSVSVATKRVGDTVEIIVRDNGTGIPDAIKDKILQPFFTTKPTGEGTGLGLSMSYDIVVKGHGGSINIESREGEFTEFTVRIK